MDLQIIAQIIGIVFLIWVIAYGWYQNDKFEKAGGWSGEPKVNKTK